MDEYPDPDVPVESVEPAQLAAKLARGEPVRLLDVRNRDEFETWQIDAPPVTSTLVPYMEWLQAEATDSVADRAADIAGEGPVVAVCGRGEASAYVAGLLSAAGIEARNLAGGMRGWARVYETATVREDPTVVQYRRPSSGCLGYVIASAGEAAVVDPLRAFTDRYLADAEERGLEVVAVLDTHVHADHVSGLRECSGAADAPRYLPEPAGERGVEFGTEALADGDTVRVGETALSAVALPGHTTGMFGFHVGGVLLSGDSLFLDGVARPDLQDGPGPAALARELHATLTDRLDRFDDATVLAPGHCEPATALAADGTCTAALGTVRDGLDALGESADEFVARTTATDPPQPANADRIVAVNLGRAAADAGEAFELELGPNNCAVAVSAGAD